MNRGFAIASVAASLLVVAIVAAPLAARADAGVDGGAFAFDPPGQLVAGSGAGRVDSNVYAPTILFPIEQGLAFANSQVWGRGGNSGGGGTQCDAQNFSYPWHDNYCETRSYNMPLCPAGVGHQGQDVRASDCTPDVHWVVAVVDGTITSIGSYTVYLTAADGTRFDYLHMASVQVVVGQKVKRGDHVGKVSNQFGSSSTTVHLHFNVFQNVAGVGLVYAPPYLSLVKAYEAHIGAAGDVDASTDAAPGTSDAAPVKPPDPPFDASLADANAAHADASGEAGCACRAGHTSAREPLLPLGAAAALALLRRLARVRDRGGCASPRCAPTRR